MAEPVNWNSCLKSALSYPWNSSHSGVKISRKLYQLFILKMAESVNWNSCLKSALSYPWNSSHSGVKISRKLHQLFTFKMAEPVNWNSCLKSALSYLSNPSILNEFHHIAEWKSVRGLFTISQKEGQNATCKLWNKIFISPNSPLKSVENSGENHIKKSY